METEALRAAYEEFFAEASAGGFGPPPGDEWTAEQIVAHVAANDELLSAATASVLAGDPRPYDNHDAIDAARLDGFVVARGGSLTALIGWGRAEADRLCALADGLGERADLPVSTHIEDGGRVAIDQPIPWSQALDFQARVHLPRHVEQLRALR